MLVPETSSAALVISMGLLGLLAFAVGVAFWQLGADKQAGIAIDSKGLLLNLGAYAAFVSWENIDRLGISTRRSNLLALGSRRQLGIALCDNQSFLQSYEKRLPATRGLMARALHLIESLLRPFRPQSDKPIKFQLAYNRAHTGYDVLIPETLLGGTAEEFIALAEAYRQHGDQRLVTRKLVLAN